MTSENEVAPSTAAPAPEPIYLTKPPEFVSLTVEDLTAFLPEDAWIGTASDKSRKLDVPAAEILSANYPRILFSRLRELLPNCVQAIVDPPEWIALPADRVALAYRPQAHPKAESAAPPKAAPIAETSPAETPPVPAWKRLPKPILAPTSGKTRAPQSESGTTTPPPLLADQQIPNTLEPRLADLFGTNATLSVSQLLEACATIAGAKAFLLQRGTEYVTTGAIADDLKAPLLGREIFSSVRKIATAAGSLKLKQALTLHTEAGAISFLRQRDLVLVIQHGSSSLTTEARARLKLVLQTIDRAPAAQR